MGIIHTGPLSILEKISKLSKGKTFICCDQVFNENELYSLEGRVDFNTEIYVALSSHILNLGTDKKSKNFMNSYTFLTAIYLLRPRYIVLYFGQKNNKIYADHFLSILRRFFIYTKEFIYVVSGTTLQDIEEEIHWAQSYGIKCIGLNPDLMRKVSPNDSSFNGVIKLIEQIDGDLDYFIVGVNNVKLKDLKVLSKKKKIIKNIFTSSTLYMAEQGIEINDDTILMESPDLNFEIKNYKKAVRNIELMNEVLGVT